LRQILGLFPSSVVLQGKCAKSRAAKSTQENLVNYERTWEKTRNSSERALHQHWNLKNLQRHVS